MPLAKTTWFYLPINPVQWEVGPLGLGRKAGKVHPKIGRSENMFAFQQEVKEFFLTGNHPGKIDGEVDLFFHFWQRLDVYEAPSGRRVTKRSADATNMQKACEDALQGILFDNDRQVKKVGSEIMAQGKDINPGIAIRVSPYISHDDIELPGHIIKARLNDLGTLDRVVASNVWPPPEGI